MRNVPSLYRLAWTRIWREGTLPAVCGAVVLIIVVLPGLLTSDGSVEGEMRLLLQYALGACIAVLGVTTVWLACSALASELRRQRLQLLLCRPVTLPELWLANWLAILCVNLLALGLAYGGTRLQIQRIIHRQQLDSEASRAVLEARERIRPKTPDVSERVDELMQDARMRQQFDNADDEEALREEMTAYARAMVYAAGPGQAIELEVDLANKRLEGAHELHFITVFSAISTYNTLLPCRWEVHALDRDLPPLVFEEAVTPAGTLTRTIPLPDTWHAVTRLQLRLFNDTRDNTHMFLEPVDGLVLAVPGTSLNRNLLRGLLLHLALLGSLSALGLAASSLFSAPVALYMSSFVLAAQAASGAIIERMELGSIFFEPQGWVRSLDQLLQRIYSVILWMLAPFNLGGHPLADLAQGFVLPWEQIGTSWFKHTLPFALLLLGLSSLLFRKREPGAVEP